MNQGVLAGLAVIGALTAVFLVVLAALVTYDAIADDGMMDGMWAMMDDMGGMMDGGMGGGGPETSGSASGTGDVRIVDFAYDPTTFTVTAGTVVTWTNEDSAPHTATAEAFDTGRLDKGESGEVTFDEPGTYEYICEFHPWMEGTVEVTAALR